MKEFRFPFKNREVALVSTSPKALKGSGMI